MLKGQSPSGVWQRFQYDAAGRLVKVMDNNSVEIESYAYGASRQRLRAIQGSLTTYYAWGGSSVLCEYTENNGGAFTFSKSYIYAGSRLLSTQVWNGTTETTEFHHPDRLGTKLVTNNSANTFYEQSTLPFGTSLDAEFIGTPTTNQRFTSYDRSQTTGIDYAVNRSYSSGQGRFTSVDPIGMSSGSIINPQSNNLYSYTQNNPIDFVDPSGLHVAGPDDEPEQFHSIGIFNGGLSTLMYFMTRGVGEKISFQQDPSDPNSLPVTDNTQSAWFDIFNIPILQTFSFSAGVVSGGGGPISNPPPTKAGPNDPCAGNKGALDFSSNMNHIFDRHITTSKNTSASKFAMAADASSI